MAETSYEDIPFDSKAITDIKLFKKDGKNGFMASVIVTVANQIKIYPTLRQAGDGRYWLAMPSQKGKDDKWYNQADTLNKKITEGLLEMVMKKFNGGGNGSSNGKSASKPVPAQSAGSMPEDDPFNG
jgi:DNA-binding cell septation regulator SpoVG